MSPEFWTLEAGAPGWPQGLPDLGRREPRHLYGVGDGELVAGMETDAAVTIVGSRRATGYGRQVAAALARDLVTAGFIVVSGMAIGIDSCAHSGALEAEGRTIAVLAGGPDVPYPPSKRRLYDEIIDRGGAVLSEWPPGRPPFREDFVERNRIMAALTAMSVVVEAADPSGSRATARDAERAGRKVGAVPGPVTSRQSEGTNSLIYDGAAMVRDAQDVLDLLVGVGARRVRGVGESLEPELRTVLDAVEAGNETPDDITTAHGGEASDVAVALVRLELLGYVRSDVFGRYARTTLATP
jgi:DNA processing protein